MKKKIILNLHSKGSVGKSTEIEARAAWFEKLKIKWSGSDFDDRHKDFSNRHPGKVTHYSVHNVEEMIGVFDELSKNFSTNEYPVHIIDSKAQFDLIFNESSKRVNYVDILNKLDISLSILVFPTQDDSSLDNLGGIIKSFRNTVDFVIVKNPAVITSFRRFENKTKIQQIIEQWGGCTIEMPKISPSTLDAYNDEVRRGNGGISFLDFSDEKKYSKSLTCCRDMQNFLNCMYVQYNNNYKNFFGDEIHEAIKQKIDQTFPHNENYNDEIIDIYRDE